MIDLTAAELALVSAVWCTAVADAGLDVRPHAEPKIRLTRPALMRYHANKRRAAKLQRTPAWACHEAMRAIYAEAARLTAETGIEHHVDHEYPLQGRLVSGLHVETNLRVLTASENSRKKNRYEVE